MRYAWLLVLAACGDGSSATDAAVRNENPLPDACSPHTIYLNRAGGMYTKGTADDASANVSSALGMSRTIPAATVADTDWTAVLACVGARLQPFGIAVTDTDPGAAPHTEVAVIDNGSQIGVPGLTAGAAPTPCAGGFGTASRQAIAFAVWQGTNANRCWDISMAIGYTLGLDNVLPCADVMSSNPSCDIPAKAFTATEQMCGDGTARNCRCGGTTQNAAARITANVPACP